MATLSQIENKFNEALSKRAWIFDSLQGTSTDCMRLFRGTADGVPGWIVDRFGALAWIQFREGECEFDWDLARALAARCQGHLSSRGIRATYLKRYVPDRSRLPNLAQQGMEFEFLVGAPTDAWQGLENGARFRILPTENFSPGLFLDQRENRAWVRERSQNLRVLNLFAYTGAFSVMAGLGGAAQVTTVDVSKKWLDVARENFLLNGLATEPHRFFATGAMGFLNSAVKRDEKYDFVLVDPPSFSRSERDGVFSLKDHRRDLLRLSADRTQSGGTVFFSCNWQQMDQGQLDREVRGIFSESEWARVKLPPVPRDFEFSDNPITKVAFRRM